MIDKESRLTDLTNGVVVAVLMSLAAVAMAIVALAQKHPRTETSFDYLGMILGVLSFITALLIGWQIWQSILSRDKLRNIDNAINHAVHFNLYNLYLLQGKHAGTNGQPSLALDFYMRCLDCVIKGNMDYMHIDEPLQAVTELQSIPQLNINHNDLKIYLRIIAKLEFTQKNELITALESKASASEPSNVVAWNHITITENSSKMRNDFYY